MKTGIFARFAKASFAVFATLAMLAFAGCASPQADVAARGSIKAADGTVLAESIGVSGGKGQRVYPEGEAASALVGSCITEGADEGIEQRYASELEGGLDVGLTIEPAVQRAAYEALGDATGAVVVLDADDGAVLAMASTPAYDPQERTAKAEALENRAVHAHIPGSTFKTVTLAAALESGKVSVDDRFAAPPELAFAEGAITNYDTTAQYPDQTLLQAYAKSINTVFAQIALQTGIDEVEGMARQFGFGDSLMADFSCEVSEVLGVGEMESWMQAWTGVGQALYQEDGELQGPVMTAVEGASMAAAIANGGTLYRPYLVSSVAGDSTEPARTPVALHERFLSGGVISQMRACMRAVVKEGTGAAAAVDGLEVSGKTGTAETASGTDDGWFIGFAEVGGRTCALAVLVESAESAEAARTASAVFEALTPAS